ncbi:hypothetical protein KR074_001211 [Drosophila pseudoananassae]|nr:hypothetical protein KR074_001211 [Drosophila pseudoananassae]
MTSKKLSFDQMNLGMPVHSDPYELHFHPSDIGKSTADEVVRAFAVNDEDLKKKLRKEALQSLPDIFVKSPESSDESDDVDFPETLEERARRLSFARRRKLHYTEFTTVGLARRLIREELANLTESVESEDIRFEAEVCDEECPPCEESEGPFPVIQYFRSTLLSHVSDDSIVKEEPEPGFNPSHHCFEALTGTNRLVQEADGDAGVPSPRSSHSIPVSLDTPADLFPAFAVIRKSSQSERDSSVKHTRVMEGNKTFDLVMRQIPKKVESRRASTRSDVKSKKSKLKDNVLRSSSRVNSIAQP